MKLTAADLHRTLADDRHHGWGYAVIHRNLLGPDRAKLDRAIVAEANALGLNYDGLFLWSDSKHGRWLDDRVTGSNEPATRATVRKELNPAVMDGLVAEMLELERAEAERAWEYGTEASNR